SCASRISERRLPLCLMNLCLFSPIVRSPMLDLGFYFTGRRRGYETHNVPAGLCYCALIVGNRYVNTVVTFRRRGLGIALGAVVAVGLSAPRAIAQSRSQDNEIVTSLTGGRVI